MGLLIVSGYCETEIADRLSLPLEEVRERLHQLRAELHPTYRALPLFLVGSGMRPEEALGLEWRDIDKANAVASVERVHSQGRTKPCKKSDRQRRRVPLRAKVLEALDRHPRRLDTRLVFPARDGDYLKLATFRLRHWTPALRAAGIDHRSVYTCRHTFAAWSIAAGVQLYYVARMMGTSVAMIDATYGHLVPESEKYLRGLLDSYDLATRAAEGEVQRMSDERTKTTRLIRRRPKSHRRRAVA